MAFFYAKVLASQGELESEMREHLATANKLRQATVEAELAAAKPARKGAAAAIAAEADSAAAKPESTSAEE